MQGKKKLLVAVFFLFVYRGVYFIYPFWVSVVALFLSGVFKLNPVVIRQTICSCTRLILCRGRVSSVNLYL